MLAEGDRSATKTGLCTAIAHESSALSIAFSMALSVALSIALWCWESYGINIADIASYAPSITNHPRQVANHALSLIHISEPTRPY